VLIQAQLPDGGTLPFGAEVLDEHGQSIGVVGQAGRIMVRVPHDRGQVNVRWEDQDGIQTCSLPYALAPAAKNPRGRSAIEQVQATCSQPQATAQVARSGT
jgi:outer membrane usher protein